MESIRLIQGKKKRNKTKQKRQTCLAQLNFWKIRDGRAYFLLGGLENWSQMRQFVGRELGDRGIPPKKV